jgi:ferredoxin
MPKVTFVRSGTSVEVPAGASFLEACREHADAHQFACTAGSCGTCILTFVSGAENVDPPTRDERTTVAMCTAVVGARLGCQLRVRGDIAVQPL